ncbi:DUF4245 domain-containing protein [Modestobacter versicolor]|uniref:DUF4245 domain-containing protein n=1 Tax=Modestobacter versicolor TaxID=429133 RepID=UPI0034DEC827
MPETGQQGQQPGPVAAGASAPVEAPAPPAVDRMQRFTAANMLRSLLPLVLGCLLVVGVTTWKQNPDDPVREVDTSGAERTAAERASYELLVPRGLSEDWRPTSVRTDAGQATAGDPITLQIGWLTPDEEFAQYVVSDDADAAALTDVLDDATDDGTEQVGGESWQRVTTERGETALTLAQGTATLLVTGSASDEELQTLAGSLQPYRP